MEKGEAMERTAMCQCGAMTVRARGEPLRRSICHCEACRKRTGSAFSWNMFFPTAALTVTGATMEVRRVADSGNHCIDWRCAACGNLMLFGGEPDIGRRGIPAAMFDDIRDLAPKASVYDDRRPDWLTVAVEERD